MVMVHDSADYVNNENEEEFKQRCVWLFIIIIIVNATLSDNRWRVYGSLSVEGSMWIERGCGWVVVGGGWGQERTRQGVGAGMGKRYSKWDIFWEGIDNPLILMGIWVGDGRLSGTRVCVFLCVFGAYNYMYG